MIEKKIVIKIGGSLLYDNKLKLRESFLELLKNWFEINKLRYSKIVIVVGGGKLSRFIGSQAVNFFYNSSAIHGIAMQGTQLNAQVIKGFLSQDNNEIKTPETLADAIKFSNDTKIKYIVSGGVKEGWSTDMDAAIYADALDLKRFYKLSNIDHIYNVDPSVNKDAKIITDISWKNYEKQFGINSNSEHTPNNNMPIDPVCANFCAKKKISLFVSGGKDIEGINDLESVFEAGTYVHG